MTWAPELPRTNRFKLSASNKAILREAFELGLFAQIHVLIPRSEARFYEKDFINHVCTLPLPTNSLVKIADGLFVARPGLCLLQMATLLDPLPLTMLAFEFCSAYSLLGANEILINDLVPTTNARALHSFLDKSAKCYGVNMAKHSIGRLIGNSASPMETKTALLFCLSFHRGGYGLPMPKMNYPIYVDNYARLATSKSSYRCDLY